MAVHVVSVFGAFKGRALVEMSVEEAERLVPDGSLAAAGPSRVVDATERELDLIRERDPLLAESALAASAVAMAYEIEHPYNSATSKSMCQSRLAEAMDRLRELMPAEEQKGALHDIRSGRARRLRVAQGGSETED